MTAFFQKCACLMGPTPASTAVMAEFYNSTFPPLSHTHTVSFCMLGALCSPRYLATFHQ